ncbi:MAG: hypothetical protein KME11_05465 [Timaviella obliquedivisa GSE-PSE-MK23-08B]|jgi:hypothetical protein|nr:hypothetical protein [Timaviella obliquedivisa GSE-PSE-MK23-08B]
MHKLINIFEDLRELQLNNAMGDRNDRLFITTMPGHVFGIDLASPRQSDGSRKKVLITKTPRGNLDDIERKKSENLSFQLTYLDYTLGKVFFVMLRLVIDTHSFQA